MVNALHHRIYRRSWRLVPPKTRASRRVFVDLRNPLCVLIADGTVILKMQLPWCYVHCPCTDISLIIDGSRQHGEHVVDEEERTFNPHTSRANFSLYPLEHLLYCEDCQDIKCPRCVIEEIVCWYCPSCLLEVPTSTVKSEGGR